MDFPVYQMSERSKRILKKALTDRHKAIAVEDVREYFKNL